MNMIVAKVIFYNKSIHIYLTWLLIYLRSKLPKLPVINVKQLLQWVYFFSQLSITCSKLTIENTRARCEIWLNCYIWTSFTPCSHIFCCSLWTRKCRLDWKNFDRFHTTFSLYINPSIPNAPWIFLGGRERMHWEQMD